MVIEIVSSLWRDFVLAWWLLLPVYISNLFPPMVAGHRPMDFGKNFWDGRRILGDSKTIEGFVFGTIVGFVVGAMETYLYPILNPIAISNLGSPLPPMNLTVAFLLSFGALVGDAAGSFIKRRLGMESGSDAPFLDQWNFIIGAVVFAYYFTTITIGMAFAMFAITPLLHRSLSILGFHLGFKKRPW